MSIPQFTLKTFLKPKPSNVLVKQFCILLVLLAVVANANAEIIYVPDDHLKIQWAVDNASVTDTIIVRDGVYVENIKIYKTLTIKSENGSANCVIKAKNPENHVFVVTADHVSIVGFTVEGSKGMYLAGIYLENANYCHISNNFLHKNNIGIYLDESSFNIIANNHCSNNEWWGIWLWDSKGNKIINNQFSNQDIGIYLSYSSGNIITNNDCSFNDEDGINIECSFKNTITNNRCSLNGEAGINIEWSGGNSIVNNHCSDNRYGIYLYNSSDGSLWCSPRIKGKNAIVNNYCSGNYYGIYVYDSSYNNIYLNDFTDNSRNVYSYNSTNLWRTKSKITYIYKNKTYINYLGNYWDDYTGNDINNDGIGENSYSIGLDKDDHPLMQPFEMYSLNLQVITSRTPILTATPPITVTYTSPVQASSPKSTIPGFEVAIAITAVMAALVLRRI